MGTPRRRDRARQLRERYGFAAQQLSLYLALLDVWDSPDAADAEGALPLVVKATRAAGPEALAEAVEAIGDPSACVRDWLGGADLPPVERYLARAALRCTEPPALRSSAETTSCPLCGGAPQLSHREPGGEPLVSGERRLLCARCWRSWKFSASVCPSCGESSGAKRTIYSDTEQLPHLRIEACGSCRHYLIDVDLNREPAAVPEVDELVAVPLDLYATEMGLTKITPNLMGF